MFRLVLSFVLLSTSQLVRSEDLRECIAGQKAKRAGQLERSIEHYQKCLDEGDLSPKYESLAYNNIGNAYLEKNLVNYAIEKFNQAIEINPTYAKPYNNRGIAYEEKGLYRHAVSDYTRSIDLDPDFLNAHNSLAWIKSTCPVTDLRNGPEAIQLATRVNQLTDWQEPLYLDTLAAAYAEKGEFTEAVKYQSMAIDLLGADRSTEHTDRLNLYKQNKPYRAGKQDEPAT